MIPATTSAATVAAALLDPGPAGDACTCAGAAPARAQLTSRLLAAPVDGAHVQPMATRVKQSPASAARRTIATRSSSAGYAPAPTTKASTSAGPLAFLSDTKLSVDERLFRLMLYVSDKSEKELDKKLKEIQARSSSGTSKGGSSGSTRKKSGLLGDIGGVIKAAVAPGLKLLESKQVQAIAKTVAGPVLAAGATAVGFPAAAPVLMQMGPQLVGAASQLSSGLDALVGAAGGGGASSGGGGSSSGSTSSSGIPEIGQADMMELQRLIEKQKEMFTLVSNILGSTHQTRMSIINNLRS